MLLVIAEWVIGAASVALLVPALVVFVEVVAACLHPQVRSVQGGSPRPRIAILVPAHNEAAGIAGPLNLIKQQLQPGDRLLVVADNCSDETAAVAMLEGAEVTQRFDQQRRGKGYALDWGVTQLRADPPELLIIVDADCRIAPGALDALARCCAGTGRPAQALYLMKSDMGAGVGARVAEFAWLVKNYVRPLGLASLKLPCQLMGTGMAFPWPLICSVELATGNIVEDMNMGAELARRGSLPIFCPEALVESDFPASEDGSRSQRTRWEHGHMQMIVNTVPGLILDAIRTANFGLFVMAADICVPPLALVVLLGGMLWAAALILCFLGGSANLLILSSLMLAIIVGSGLLAWSVYGRRIISFSGLAYASVYALAKIPVYARFLVARQVKWVRAKRAGD